MAVKSYSEESDLTNCHGTAGMAQFLYQERLLAMALPTRATLSACTALGGPWSV